MLSKGARRCLTTMPSQNKNRSSTSMVKYDTAEKQRLVLDSVGTKLGISKPEDWYRVTVARVQELGEGGLLNHHFDGSLQRAVTTLYPEHKWIPWKFNSVPNRFWDDAQNQKAFLEWLSLEKGITSMEDWYKLNTHDFRRAGGGGLLFHKFHDSISELLKHHYPGHLWLEWKFQSVPRSFWASQGNRRKFLDWVAKELNMHSYKEWYTVRPQQIIDLGGGSIVRNHMYTSVVKLVTDAYPEYKWEDWLWTKLKIHKAYLNKVMQDHGMKDLSDWYGVNPLYFDGKKGPRFLRMHYGGSLQQALEAVYPSHAWDGSKFLVRTPPSRAAAGKDTLGHLATLLKVLKPEDWYGISEDQVSSLKPSFLTDYGDGTLFGALKWLQPEHKWDADRFQHASL